MSTQHIDRFWLTLPDDAELVDLSLEIEGFECTEFDIADPSPTAPRSPEGETFNPPS